MLVDQKRDAPNLLPSTQWQERRSPAVLELQPPRMALYNVYKSRRITLRETGTARRTDLPYLGSGSIKKVVQFRSTGWPHMKDPKRELRPTRCRATNYGCSVVIVVMETDRIVTSSLRKSLPYLVIILINVNL